MDTERNCQSCNYYKDGYCENLELKPCYPQKGCDDFENKDLGVLDKLRAEIEKEIIPRNSDQYDHEAMWQNMGLRMALKTIDKYKAESEG